MKADEKTKVHDFKIEDCRMYRKQYPKSEDLVMCKIVETVDEGSTVELLEYNNIRGMILKSEVSRKRIKNLKQAMKEGKEEVLQVMRVDTEQGYIDLSKKDIKAEENKDFQENFSKSKQAHNIMKSIAIKLHESNLEKLYDMIGWPLYDDYGHAYEAFKLISRYIFY